MSVMMKLFSAVFLCWNAPLTFANWSGTANLTIMLQNDTVQLESLNHPVLSIVFQRSAIRKLGNKFPPQIATQFRGESGRNLIVLRFLHASHSLEEGERKYFELERIIF